MRKSILLICAAVALLIAGYSAGSRNAKVALANYDPIKGSVPKSYGKLVAAINDQIGTGLVFEDETGVIRFVAMTGMTEGALQRYDKTPTQGGIPKAYGHLVAAVANPKGTGLVFEDEQGAIRFVTLTGTVEGELDRK
jgi:hypothetical protein